jgi:hypothetical protein
MNISAFRALGLLFLAAALSFVAPGSLWAAAINFDDTNPNDTIILSVNDFEGGFFLNGALIQQGTQNPVSVTVQEDGPLNFSGSWLDLGQAQPGDRIIYLVESPYDPALPTTPLISDILRYTIGRDDATGLANISGTFLSDFENNLGTLPVGTPSAIVFLEDGKPVIFTEAFLSGAINSDPEVPEPSSVCLAALGFIGLAAWGWRRKR